MLIKRFISYPKHLLLKFKKSIHNVIVFWVFSPYGVVKRAMSDLFFFRRGDCALTLYFFLKKKKSELDSIETQCTLLRSAFVGVSRRYSLDLWLKGVGFKFNLVPCHTPEKGTYLNLSLGFSHTLKMRIPVGSTITLVGKKKIFFTGICHHHLTQLLAYIQSFKSPDPYKGKGLNYKYKVKVLKPGKKS